MQNPMKKMTPAAHWSLSLVLGMSALLLTNCAPKPFLHPNYQQMKPKVLVVLPPDNVTSNDEVEKVAYPILYEKFSNRGYYCIAPELVRSVFNANRMENAGKINALPPQKMQEVFGADAVLRVRVTEWSTKYIIIDSKVTITVELEMVDAKTAEKLWEYKHTVSKSPGNSGGGLIGAMVNAALFAALEKYEPIMEDNAKAVVMTVPMGDYGKAATSKK
jgi:hypothetical protein